MESKTEEETSMDSKGSDGESLDDIKKFIEDQEREFQEQKVQEMKANGQRIIEPLEETLAVATSVMDMILCESEAKVASTNCEVKTVPQTLCTDDKGNNSMALSVGSKVEAKDFEEEWYPASIIEVDYDEMEVLVHYENESKKHDEWISVSSPRLRPVGSGPKKPPEVIPPQPEPEVKDEAKEVKMEEKPKVTFEAGERCLARWRDNRRFMATVNRHLDNGNYEILFDDGFHWTCNVIRLSKLKAEKQETLTIDTNFKSNSAALSPVYGPGPSNVASTPMPAYHTHLFDPARDYLSSKLERREMKRKLNIKEIFNIGQKRPKTQKTPREPRPVVRKPKVKRTVKAKPVHAEVKTEVKTGLPDAVASIIGTVDKPDTPTMEDSTEKVDDNQEVVVKEEDQAVEDKFDSKNDEGASEADLSDFNDSKPDHDPVLDEEVKLEKFDKQDEVKHEEVLDRIKEVINKLEDGLKEEKNYAPKKIKEVINILEDRVKDENISPPKPIPQEEVVEKLPIEETAKPSVIEDKERAVEKPKKMKKSKKLRLLQEKKVKKQVEKVKNELEEMKKQVEEMRQQMLLKTQEFSGMRSQETTEGFLLPGMWCCKWLNGQPVGMVSEIECEPKVDANNKPALPRRSVQVEDKRLPEGWTKHMVRRSLGHSAGKWDVVLISPENRRFHTKNEMRNYLENNPDAAERLQAYEHALLDFGVHLKLSRRMGWITHTPGGLPDDPDSRLPAGTLSSTSPLVKRKKLTLKKKDIKDKHKKRRLTIKIPREYMRPANIEESSDHNMSEFSGTMDSSLDQPPLEDGFVYVGSLKVQIIDNLLRCPADGCFKNFRNNTLLQMHIKHYHRELRKMLGATPKVSDLAYARTMPETEEKKPTLDPKIIKVKLPKPKREEPKLELKVLIPQLVEQEAPTTPVKTDFDITEPSKPKGLDSPKLRLALVNKPVKRPRVLLPVRRPEPEPMDIEEPVPDFSDIMTPVVDVPSIPPPLDFETAISTHTVTKPAMEKKRKGEMRKSFAAVAKRGFSEEEEWFGVNSDVDTRSSFPRSGTPDSKSMVEGKNAQPVSSESNEEQRDSNMYTFTESGERIKIVHMKREEIINCHCGFREEDGLMVQCELCLCWQHALCHNIQRESEVPDKYTCSICLNPRRGRRSQRFLHDQDRLYEGLLPGAAPSEPLRRQHELAGNLLRLHDALHALRVKFHVAIKKNHPKLYLWAEDWENGELYYTQEKLNSEYSDLNIMINTLGKENLPMKGLGMTPPTQDDDNDRYTQRDAQLGSHSLLSGLLSSPGGASLDLPISSTELERLAKSVQEPEPQRVVAAPQPEAAIENSACRERLLRHISRCHAIIDARLDSIEAQVAELESQDPSFEDDETADYFPRTKQTIQMLMRDLDTMEELGVIT